MQFETRTLAKKRKQPGKMKEAATMKASNYNQDSLHMEAGGCEGKLMR